MLLDGRALKTPGKLALSAPHETIAQLIAAEWEAQEGEINPAAMPITRLLNVATERTPDNRDELITEARQYAGSDLLCYRAPQPKDLTARQAELWSPWLDWAGERGVELISVEGITATEQPAASLDAMADYAASLTDIALTLFVHFTAVFGSAVLAMAVMEGALTAGDALDLSRLDEQFQIEIWGEDEEAKLRTENITRDVLALAQIVPLV